MAYFIVSCGRWRTLLGMKRDLSGDRLVKTTIAVYGSF